MLAGARPAVPESSGENTGSYDLRAVRHVHIAVSREIETEEPVSGLQGRHDPHVSTTWALHVSTQLTHDYYHTNGIRILSV